MFKDEDSKTINKTIMNGLRLCGDWNGREEENAPTRIIEGEDSFFSL